MAKRLKGWLKRRRKEQAPAVVDRETSPLIETYRVDSLRLASELAGKLHSSDVEKREYARAALRDAQEMSRYVIMRHAVRHGRTKGGHPEPELEEAS